MWPDHEDSISGGMVEGSASDQLEQVFQHHSDDYIIQSFLVQLRILSDIIRWVLVVKSFG